jgi:hypothetical protein
LAGVLALALAGLRGVGGVGVSADVDVDVVRWASKSMMSSW